MNLTEPFNIKPPRTVECVARKRDDGRCDIEVEGHVIHNATFEPIRVKSHTVCMWPPTAEDFRSLLVTFFDHEVREQLGMDPHGPIDPVAANLIKERDAALARAAAMREDLIRYDCGIGSCGDMPCEHTIAAVDAKYGTP